MTVDEVFQQAQHLSMDERQELVRRLQRDLPPQPTPPPDTADRTWADDELTDLLQPAPLTGGEIVAAGLAGAWADLDIADGMAWVEDQRRMRRDRRQW